MRRLLLKLGYKQLRRSCVFPTTVSTDWVICLASAARARSQFFTSFLDLIDLLVNIKVLIKLSNA
ncbi:hypothetical protein BOTU111922_09865 [Bordetella tumulicola]